MLTKSTFGDSCMCIAVFPADESRWEWLDLVDVAKPRDMYQW